MGGKSIVVEDEISYNGNKESSVWQYGKIYTILLIATVASAVPLFTWLGTWAFIPWGIIFAFSMYFAFKIERVKKTMTYKHIKKL